MKTFEASPAKEFMRVTLASFQKYKQLGDNTFEQLSEEDWYAYPNDESNSIAILVQHISGNLKSRFTDFLIEDGEKKERNRDAEFEHHTYTGAELKAQWEAGFDILFQTLNELQEGDLSRIVFIRHEPLSVPEALIRALSHISYHIGQIVFLGKQIKDTKWKNLSIERGQSTAYNKKMTRRK